MTGDRAAALVTLRLFMELSDAEQDEWLAHLRRVARAANEGTAPAGTGAAPSDPAAHDGLRASREGSPCGCVGADSDRRS